MTSVTDIINRISAQLHGYGGTQDRVANLSANIGASDTQFTVSTGQSMGLSPGVVEIGTELVFIQDFDQTAGLATVAPFGRGYLGTVAASHTAPARVISRPKFPRIEIFNALNDVIGSVYPLLFKVATFTDNVKFPTNTYALPSNPKGLTVLDAQWQDPIGDWQDCGSYKIDPYDGAFRLGEGPMPGRPLRVLYTAEPPLLTAETDDFQTVTGLPDSCVDVARLGVVARMVPGLDISRAQLKTVEQSDRGVVPPNAGIAVSQHLFAVYQERLHNEAQALRRRFRTRIVRTF